MSRLRADMHVCFERVRVCLHRHLRMGDKMVLSSWSSIPEPRGDQLPLGASRKTWPNIVNNKVATEDTANICQLKMNATPFFPSSVCDACSLLPCTCSVSFSERFFSAQVSTSTWEIEKSAYTALREGPFWNGKSRRRHVCRSTARRGATSARC
jgi:hypothetical protein